MRAGDRTTNAPRAGRANEDFLNDRRRSALDLPNPTPEAVALPIPTCLTPELTEISNKAMAKLADAVDPDDGDNIRPSAPPYADAAVGFSHPRYHLRLRP